MCYCKTTNHKEKGRYKQKKSKQESAFNITEESIHNYLFIAKGSSSKDYNKKFATDYDVMVYMVTTEENISNQCGA